MGLYLQHFLLSAQCGDLKSLGCSFVIDLDDVAQPGLSLSGNEIRLRSFVTV